MQSSNDKEKKNTSAGQNQELSEAWRALLGLRSSELDEALEGDTATQVQPLADDPWSHLIHSQGMQSVDLQKIHLHDLYPNATDDDVEHALNIMRESTGQLRAMNEQSGEKEG